MAGTCGLASSGEDGLLTISMFAVVLGLGLGIPFGALSGYYGGWFDTIPMRFVDAWLAFPGLLFYLILVTIAREWKFEGFWLDTSLIIALGTAQIPRLARLVRGSVLVEKEKEYVEASRIIGESNLYIALRQVSPTACHQ